MARIQILELPEGSSDDRPPFVLVVDQADYDSLSSLSAALEGWQNIKGEIGAQAVLVFQETIDIPANDTTAYLDTAANGALPPDAHYEMVIDDKPVTWTRADEAHARTVDAVQERTDIARDMDRLAKWREELADALGMDRTCGWDATLTEAAELRRYLGEARTWARHGYEIGQRHCGWSDHGVAPAWLTEGWPPHIDSCEHLQQAAEYDTALTRVRGLPEQPEAMDAQHPDPTGYLHGYAVAVREAKRASYPSELAESGDTERSPEE